MSVQTGEARELTGLGFLEIGICCTKDWRLTSSWCGWKRVVAHVLCRQAWIVVGSGDWGALR